MYAEIYTILSDRADRINKRFLSNLGPTKEEVIEAAQLTLDFALKYEDKIFEEGMKDGKME